MIVKMHRRGASDVWRFTRDGKFAGLIITINGENHILLAPWQTPIRIRKPLSLLPQKHSKIIIPVAGGICSF